MSMQDTVYICLSIPKLRGLQKINSRPGSLQRGIATGGAIVHLKRTQ